MISIEIPNTYFIIGEIIVGIIVAAVWEDLPRVLGVLSVIGFILGLFVFAFSNPTALQDLDIVSDKITYIIVALVTMILHSLFFDIGVGIVEAIRHPSRR
ncbi:MAG: hypothetical protein HZA84_04555 [Thaumarchaeota archaeon]|nr:hypothetical protein [Nitrososphaerota archaeon]